MITFLGPLAAATSSSRFIPTLCLLGFQILPPTISNRRSRWTSCLACLLHIFTSSGSQPEATQRVMGVLDEINARWRKDAESGKRTDES